MTATSNLCVVMTGTVQPEATTVTHRPDPKLRLEEYARAITATAQALQGQPGVSILFAENSGAASEELADVCGRAGVELVLATQTYSASAKGKGAGELALLNAVAAVCWERGGDHLLKLTGRLRIGNIVNVVQEARDQRYDLLCPLVRPGWAESRVVGLSRPGLELLSRQQGRLDDAGGVYLEHVLADAVRAAAGAGLVWRYPRTNPRFSGASGSTGALYDAGMLGRLKSNVLELGRRSYYRLRPPMPRT